jgi:hypothetical protein
LLGPENGGGGKKGVAAGILFLVGLEPEILWGGHFYPPPPLVLRVSQIGMELQGLSLVIFCANSEEA